MTDTKKKLKKVEVDKTTCIGCGTCVVIASKAFELGSDGVAVTKLDALTQEDENLIVQAAQACPTGSIKISYNTDHELPNNF